MLFHTWPFLLAFAVFFLVYHSLRRTGQNLLLLAGSYAFMALFDWRFLLLMQAYTLVNHLGARWMGHQSAGARKASVTLLVCLNLGGLAFFKYYNFFIESAAALLNLMGMAAHPATLNLILPVGISFYTFMGVGYLLDVYRGELPAERNLLHTALFLGYFPVITAGPIERAGNLLPQFAQARVMDGSRLLSGAFLLLMGLVRKVGIADALAAQVDPAFADPAALTTWQLWVALFLYFLLLYCDFSGYSDMARGVSRLLGIDLMRNFEQPYFSLNIAEFWRRWHISLSSWLRDYLYIPLGGGRGSSFKTYRNLSLTMILCGLWHGPAWHYVAWGASQAASLCLHRAWGRLKLPQRLGVPAALKPLGKLASWALTMLVTALGWILFRSPDMNIVWAYLQGLLIPRGGVEPAMLITPALMTCLFLLLELPQRLTGQHAAMLRWPRPLQAAIFLGFLVWLALAPAPPEQKAFVYLAF